MQEVDQLLEWLDQWAGFSPESRSVNHRRIVYGAWLLFLVEFTPACRILWTCFKC